MLHYVEYKKVETVAAYSMGSILLHSLKRSFVLHMI